MVQYRKTRSKLSKIVIVTIVTMFTAGVMTTQAQQSSFTDAYLKLCRPLDGKDILVQKLGKKEIRELLNTPEPEGQTEEERKKSLREKEMLKNVKQINMIFEMEEEGLLSSSQLSNLLKPYQELASMKTEDGKMTLGAVLKKGKIKELVFLVSDTEDDGCFFANILFKKPVRLQEYMENPEDVTQLFSVNAPVGENDNALFKIKFSKELQVDGKSVQDIHCTSAPKHTH